LDEQQISLVRKFLKKFKKIASGGRGIYMVPREESLKALAELGLTKRNFKELILTLSVTDYCAGPKRDIDRSGEIWIFGKQVEGREIYIKLKMAQVSGKMIAKCISFHPAAFPLCYPFQTDARRDKE
jgi:hypothetical protein